MDSYGRIYSAIDAYMSTSLGVRKNQSNQSQYCRLQTATLPPTTISCCTSRSTASTVHLEPEMSPGRVLRLMRKTVPGYPRPEVSPSPIVSPSPPGRAKNGAYWFSFHFDDLQVERCGNKMARVSQEHEACWFSFHIDDLQAKGCGSIMTRGGVEEGR